MRRQVDRWPPTCKQVARIHSPMDSNGKSIAMTGLLETSGIAVTGPIEPGFGEILTRPALEFLAKLERRFRARRASLLAEREARQRAFDDGARPRFLAETADVRSGDWMISPVPHDLVRRVVEITGPVDRKMVINALNSGADVYMADFEDSTSPTWKNIVGGQINLRDAVLRTIEHHSEGGKHYCLGDSPATLMVRPRGLHLSEKHVLVDGERISACLLDFGLYFFHNAHALLAAGSGPYFYLPKLEGYLEARFWNDVFVFAQKELGIPQGTIKATVLVETVTAAFEVEEILFELRDHSAGLNCGRWDYIFSVIKKFRRDSGFVLPDRAEVTMTSHFLRNYSRLVIEACHRRGAHAMGGMAAQIPIKDDAEANRLAMQKVRADKDREVNDGHDGTWVAHPGLIGIAREAFTAVMDGSHQLHRQPETPNVRALLMMPRGSITEEGLRTNLRVATHYLAAWLSGNGCVPIRNLMEDAATAEISRAQVWQWIHHSARLVDRRVVTEDLVRELLADEVAHLANDELGEAHSQLSLAADLVAEIVTATTFAEFITLAAYELL